VENGKEFHYLICKNIIFIIITTPCVYFPFYTYHVTGCSKHSGGPGANHSLRKASQSLGILRIIWKDLGNGKLI